MAVPSRAELRSALSGLTTRGRSFAAAGSSCGLAGLVLGERDLVRIGVLLIALPLAAVLSVVRSRYRLSCTRTVEPARLAAGESTTVTVRVRNLSRLPTSVLLVEDQLPRELGTAPRFVLDRVPTDQQRSVAYRVRTRTRGIWRVGPLSVRLADPFGFCELVRSFTASDQLVVTPAITPLPPASSGGDWSRGGEGLAAALSLGSEDDVGTRPYRDGDDLRRVHWRTTARTGELTVRQEGLPYQARATLLLDTRLPAAGDEHLPVPPSEWAVSAIASVAVALARRGFALQLVDAAGRVRVSAPAAGAEHAVLTALAGIVCEDECADLSLASATLAGMPGTLVAALVRPARAAVLPLLGAGSAAGGRAGAFALLADGPSTRLRGTQFGGVDRRGDGGGVNGARDLLAAAGWAVGIAGPDTRLDALWPELLRSSSARVLTGR